MRRILFLLLILIFLFTRLCKIGGVPSSVYWDEASIGYNAYSVLLTGGDEWGEFLPLHFRAFGEFKLPVYIYSTIPFVYFFGLNEVSVRLPSVIYSLLSLVIIYFLVRKMFKGNLISFMSAFLFAFLPWNFVFSRTGYEASAGLFFYLLSLLIWFYFRPFDLAQRLSVRNLLSHFIFLMSLVFSVYSYNSFRFWTPATFIFLVTFDLIKQSGDFKRKLFWILIYLVLFIVSFYPIYRLYKFDYGGVRFQVVSLQGSLEEKLVSFSKNYVSHFSFDFLFRNGDSNLRSQLPGFGQIYIFSLPFLVLGIIYLIKKRNFYSLLLAFLILIASIPASLTRESPHALRAILFAFVWPIVISSGIVNFVDILKRKYFVISVICVMYLFLFGFYFLKFVRDFNTLAYYAWQGEYKDIFVGKSDLINKSGKIIVSDAFAQPYIFALFYNKVDPNEFRENVVYNSSDKWGFSTVYSFGKFIFKTPEETDLEDADLVFSDKELLSLNAFLIDRIVWRDGRTVFWIYRK